MNTDEIIHDLHHLYRSVEKQFRENPGEYWQGKKDGLRTALALLEPERNWKELNDTSPGKKLTDNEIIQEMLSDAYYNITAALWEIEKEKRLHPQTRMNLVNWYHAYKHNADNGLLDKIEDACY